MTHGAQEQQHLSARLNVKAAEERSKNAIKQKELQEAMSIENVADDLIRHAT